VPIERQALSASAVLRAAGRGMFWLILCCVSTAVAGESVRQITRRAEQGDASAQYRLGRIYERGQGVNEDYRRALHWYRKAADANRPEAQYSLGRMYASGLGTKTDYVEALSWLRKAAAQNFSPAMNRLGVMYERGHGVPRDNVEAYKWYTLAGSNVAAVANREMLSRQMTAAEMRQVEQRLEQVALNLSHP
jgi:hypothetical protein